MAIIISLQRELRFFPESDGRFPKRTGVAIVRPGSPVGKRMLLSRIYMRSPSTMSESHVT